MASVFLSYDREDVGFARAIAAALEKSGHSVWWDQQLKGGAQYSKEIEQALKRADAVVVLWSERSVESAWVRDEAAAGRDSGRLVPAALDRTEPPLGFRQYHTINLSTGKRRPHAAALEEVVGAVDALGGSGQSPTTGSVETAPRRPGLTLRHMLLALAILAIGGLAAGLLAWRPWAQQQPAAVVIVIPGDQTPAAKDLARDLLVGLGDAQAASSGTFELVDGSSTATPDLIFEVSGAASAASPGASLVLLQGRDRQLLASHNVQAAMGRPADLKGSLAASAAQLLDCATEALAVRGQPLGSANLKLYLGLCVKFGTVYGAPEPAYALVSQFEQLVRKAPQFAPAWKKLLLLEASLQSLPDDHDKPPPARLKSYIAEAQRIDSEMPEADIAKAELLATSDFAKRLELADRAVALAPTDALIHLARAAQLMRVGRHNDAVADAEQAVTLDPDAPAIRNAFILVLAYSGRTQRAINELDEAQRLWPTAHNLLDTRFRLNYRSGDPNVSLQIMRAHGSGVMAEAVLQARIDPTPANVERAIVVGNATAARFSSLIGGQIETLAIFGRDDQAYEFLMRLPPQRFEANLVETLFRPTLKGFRQNPRFLTIAQRFGLLDYWRKSGKWPDFCSGPDLPYDCKKEAAKLAA